MNQQIEQLPISSTDPRPPTGQTPTQPPLSSSSTVGSAPTEEKNQLIPMNHMTFLLNQPYYMGNFSISSSDPINKSVFDWIFEDFLQHMSLNRIMWQSVPLLFAAQFNLEMELIFQPVKVGDSIVTLDYLWSYDRSDPSTGDSNKWQNDWQEIAIVDSKPIAIKVPLFWMMEMITTSTELPFFVPNTRLAVEIKNKYSPPPIHPSAFQVLVFGRFNKVLSTEVRTPHYTQTGSTWMFDALEPDK